MKRRSDTLWISAVLLGAAFYAAAPAAAGLNTQDHTPIPPQVNGGVGGPAASVTDTGGLLTAHLSHNPLPGCLNGVGLEDLDSSEVPANADPAGPEVLRLPPTPDSSTLFWWALSSLGAWQLGRYSRKLALSALPEWYHAGGPVQIGQSQRWDWQRPTWDIPLWYQTVPLTTDESALPVEFGGAECIRITNQRPLTAAPRGPPCSFQQPTAFVVLAAFGN